MHDLFDLLGDATQPLLDARNVRYLMEWHTRLPLHALSHMTRNRRRNGFYLISTFLLSSFVHEQIKNREIWNKSSRDWFNKNDPGAVAVTECLSGSQSASICYTNYSWQTVLANISVHCCLTIAFCWFLRGGESYSYRKEYVALDRLASNLCNIYYHFVLFNIDVLQEQVL